MNRALRVLHDLIEPIYTISILLFVALLVGATSTKAQDIRIEENLVSIREFVGQEGQPIPEIKPFNDCELTYEETRFFFFKKRKTFPLIEDKMESYLSLNTAGAKGRYYYNLLLSCDGIEIPIDHAHIKYTRSNAVPRASVFKVGREQPDFPHRDRYVAVPVGVQNNVIWFRENSTFRNAKPGYQRYEYFPCNVDETIRVFDDEVIDRLAGRQKYRCNTGDASVFQSASEATENPHPSRCVWGIYIIGRHKNSNGVDGSYSLNFGANGSGGYEWAPRANPNCQKFFQKSPLETTRIGHTLLVTLKILE